MYSKQPSKTVTDFIGNFVGNVNSFCSTVSSVILGIYEPLS